MSVQPSADSPAQLTTVPAPRGRVARRAVLLGAGCGFVYLLIAGSFDFQFKQTDCAHHILMADALLHGQLPIRPQMLRDKRQRVAASLSAEMDEFTRITGQILSQTQRQALLDNRLNRATADWAALDGKVYGYWAPLTPVVMMPFVAALGTDVSDQLINVLFGALNITLFYWLLCRVNRAGLLRMDEPCRVGLTLLLAFGTSHFWLTCAAQVWFAVHIVTLTALLAALLAACSLANGRRHWLASGVFFGAAILGRNIVAVTGLFFIVLMWMRSAPAGNRRRRTFLTRLALFCLPIAAAVAAQGVYNQARFGSLFDSGLEIQVSTGGMQRFSDAYQEHGAFSLHYVPHNLYYYFVNWRLPREADGRIWHDREGNSLFLVTPPMLYVLASLRRRTTFTLALFCGVVPLAAVLMLYLATGFVQFGPRYLLDVMPLLLLLVATGMTGRLTHVSYTLIVLAVAANSFGTYRLCEQEFALIEPWVRAWTLPALVAVALLARVLAALRHRRHSTPTQAD